MSETQKKKKKIKKKKTKKKKKKKEKARAKNLDEITLKPLRKGWQLHHNCLDEKEYENMSKSFLCCNNLTHKFIHWLYTYYKTDKQILCRIKKEMKQMEKENER
mgnify:CR=1 FL=1